MLIFFFLCFVFVLFVCFVSLVCGQPSVVRDRFAVPQRRFILRDGFSILRVRFKARVVIGVLRTARALIYG